jgi:hypothetical protein
MCWHRNCPNPDCEIPYGECHCGCGRRTNRAKATRLERGWVKERPLMWILGHQNRKSGVDYIEQDRGYETPCWVWQRAQNGTGYGVCYVGKRNVLAHRVYYEVEHGRVPEGLEIDHLCRVKLCCRPSHLEAVTHAQNQQRRPATKLTPDAVREIRTAHPADLAAVAAKHGVAFISARHVRYRRFWKDVA